jgi:hypothetical protein
VSLLAAVRPDDWNLPLFLHVLGAMVLVGSLVLAVGSLASAARSGQAPITRLGFRSLLLGALPSFIVMRVSAEWIADKEGFSGADEAPAWIDTGYILADPSALMLLVALLLCGLGTRRARRGAAGGGLVRVAAVLAALMLLAGLAAVYVMTTKPT